jgi:hypothetical protein
VSPHDQTSKKRNFKTRKRGTSQDRFSLAYASGYEKSATSIRVSEGRVKIDFPSLTRRVTKRAQLQKTEPGVNESSVII